MCFNLTSEFLLPLIIQIVIKILQNMINCIVDYIFIKNIMIILFYNINKGIKRRKQNV